jgi:hypothetical protein
VARLVPTNLSNSENGLGPTFDMNRFALASLLDILGFILSFKTRSAVVRALCNKGTLSRFDSIGTTKVSTKNSDKSFEFLSTQLKSMSFKDFGIGYKLDFAIRRTDLL